MANVYRNFGVPIYLPASTDPTNNNYASPRGWVNDTFLSKAGGTMTGAITLNAGASALVVPSGGSITVQTGCDITAADAPSASTDLANKTYVDTMMPLAGGTFTGAITLAGSGNALVVPSGGEIQIDTGGDLTLTDAPVDTTDAANKAYVDAQVGASSPRDYSTATHTAGADITVTHGTAYGWGILQAFNNTTKEPIECTYDCTSNTVVTAHFTSSQAQDTVRFVWHGVAAQ